jgi:hypothetical protein
MITYVSADEAKSSRLAYVQDDGVAVMTVDTTMRLSPGAYRKSYVLLALGCSAVLTKTHKGSDNVEEDL